MEEPIIITNLNDFIFCPLSIYYHDLYGDLRKVAFQSPKQLAGTFSHASVDNSKYSTSKNILQGIGVYSDKYGLVGKIDCLHYFDFFGNELMR